MADTPHPFTDREAFVLGKTAGEHRVERAAEAADAALALARQARRTLRIFSRDLDAPLYSSEGFREAVSALARLQRGSEIRILVQDPTPAIKSDHRLVGLAQHLSSHIHIRRIGREWADEPSAFLLADDHGLLWRPNGAHYEGVTDFHAAARALELSRWFDRVWEHSHADLEFRRLAL